MQYRIESSLVLLESIQLFQLGFLDSVTEGVEVSRQDLGGGQYRWTITFLDEGDDFDLQAESNFLSGATGTTDITTIKVPLG